MGWWRVALLANWHLYHDDKIGRLTSGGENTSSLTSLVDWARVLLWVWLVSSERFEVDYWHLVVKFSLFKVKVSKYVYRVVNCYLPQIVHQCISDLCCSGLHP